MPKGAVGSGVGEGATVGSTVAVIGGVATAADGEVAVGDIAAVGVGVGARVGRGVTTGTGTVGAGPAWQPITSKTSTAVRIAVNARASIIRDAQI